MLLLLSTLNSFRIYENFSINSKIFELYRIDNTFSGRIKICVIRNLDTIWHYLSMYTGTRSISVQDQQ